MNLLALINRARQECGVSGQPLATVQTGLTLEGQRFLTWMQDAWNDLQIAKPDWQWMRKTATFNTTPGKANYAPTDIGITGPVNWKLNSFRCYHAAIGYGDEMILPPQDWDTFLRVWLFGANRTMQTRPVTMAVNPQDHSLQLGPIPDDVYTVVAEYFRAPTALSADSDDPSSAGNDLPVKYHMLLVYETMERYAAYESAPEVAQRAAAGKKRVWQQLLRDYMPPVTFGPPL
jgi:hypothetical protein